MNLKFLQIGAMTLGAWALGIGIASASPIYVESVPAPMSKVMPELQKSLVQHHFQVVLHVDILKMLRAKQDKLHLPNLDKPGFNDVQTLVFCNPFFYNQLLNSHWQSATACPLTLMVYSRGGESYIAYSERVALTKGTPALGVAKKIDQAVIGALSSLPGSKPVTQ